MAPCFIVGLRIAQPVAGKRLFFFRNVHGTDGVAAVSDGTPSRRLGLAREVAACERIDGRLSDVWRVLAA